MEAVAITALGVIGFGVATTNMVARRLKVPAVLIYLAIGAVAGPSLLGVIDPHEIGPIFEITIELLVALIVFEGAFSIDTHYLRRVGSVVRNLLSVGLVGTFLAATLVAGSFDVLPWRTAFLFGALVTVSGPTVIAPLVRRRHLNDHVKAVLMGEGVLIDPLGAILSIVVLEAALSGFHADPLLWVPSRLAGGLLFGGLGAMAVLTVNRAPTFTETALLLFGLSVATFALAERLLPDSGLTAMAPMGIVLASMRAHIPHADEVSTFEDDISQLLLGAIYVLAAAQVDLQVIRDLWPNGFIVVAVLMVAIRPAVVAISALGSDLNWRERAFLGSVGPRGVVAIALAAVGGEALGAEFAGERLTALVFITVLMTVGVQSSYAGVLARLLKVKAMRAVIAGGGPLSRRVGRELGSGGFDVVLVEEDVPIAATARAEGLTVEEGDVTDVKLLAKLGVDTAEIAVGATRSDQANLLFCQYVRSVNPDAQVFARVSQDAAVEAFEHAGIRTVSEVDALSEAMMDLVGSPVLHRALSSGGGQRMTIDVPIGSGLAGRRIRELDLPESVLVLLLQRGERDVIPNGGTSLQLGDRMLLFGETEAVQTARELLVAIE